MPPGVCVLVSLLVLLPSGARCGPTAARSRRPPLGARRCAGGDCRSAFGVHSTAEHLVYADSASNVIGSEVLGQGHVFARPVRSKFREDQKVDDADYGDESEEDEDQYWVMTTFDKVWLQVGWIIIFLGILAVIFIWSKLDDILIYPPHDALERRHGAPAASGGRLTDGYTWRDDVFQALYGKSSTAKMVNVVIVVLACLNFYTYSIITESKLEIWCKEGGEASFGTDRYLGGCTDDLKEFLERHVEADSAWEYSKLGPLDPFLLNAIVEVMSVFIFAAVTVLRLMVIHVHPDFEHYGWTAALRYIGTNSFIQLEFIAVNVSLLNLAPWWLAGHHQHMNLLWFFFFRTLEMLERTGSGMGLRKLRNMLYDDGKLLATAFMFGLVIWLIMSCLYFLSNRHNTDGEDSTWGAARYVYNESSGEPEPWTKFESIPSSMWFVLINLVKEHPLADAHITFWQRLWVCVVCIFAMPLFALPTSVLQYSLFKSREAAEGNDDEGRFSYTFVDRARGESCFGLPSFYGGLLTGFLSFFSIVAWFFYTARDTDHHTFLLVPIKVSSTTLAILDGFVAFVFLLEWAHHLGMAGRTYMLTSQACIDVMAWLPSVAHLAMFLGGGCFEPVTDWVTALCVLRVFKIERYLHCFRDLSAVTYTNRAILLAALLCSTFVWMLYSQALYITERHTYDSEMIEQYGSLLRSPWAEVINLHGEWPWADYTAAGKGIATGAALFGIMIFCIPISVFGQGFREQVERTDSGNVSNPEASFDRRCWQARCRPGSAGYQQRAYDIFFETLHGVPASREYRLVRAVHFTAVFAATFISCVNTVPKENWWQSGLWPSQETVWDISYAVDWLLVLYFVADFAARTLALGWRHPLSIVGVLEIVSLLAQILTLDWNFRPMAFHPDYRSGYIVDDIIVPLRLLRLLSLEQYAFSFHTLRNVLYLNRWMLIRSGGVLLSMWFCHATILYLLEHDDTGEQLAEWKKHKAECIEKAKGDEEKEEECGEMQMFQRYDSVLRALQYSIVHLFGDYPETDYTLSSKVVHFIGIMFGIAILATFTGVFSASFTRYVMQERAEELKELKYRQLLACGRVARMMQKAYRTKKATGSLGTGALSRRLPAPVLAARSIVGCTTPRGLAVRWVFAAALAINILNTLITSLPDLDSPRYIYIKVYLGFIEFGCTGVFVVEYMVHWMAAPAPRHVHMLRAMRILDLVCLFPGLMLILYEVSGIHTEERTVEAFLEAAVMIRAARILDLPYFQREVNMISRSLVQATKLLFVPAYLSLCVWIQTSALFMWLENYWGSEAHGEDSTKDSMTSVPEAMYWCCIFLTGEWANVDFTFAASRLCIFYVIFGIAMFSIPVGIIVEAVQSTMTLVAQEEADVKSVVEDRRNSMGQAKGEERLRRSILLATSVLPEAEAPRPVVEMEMTTMSNG